MRLEEADWWTDLPPSPGPEQDHYVYHGHELGLVTHTWHQLDLGLVVVWVSACAANVGGRRVRYSARGQQRVADFLGAHLLTPALVDAIWTYADTRLMPKPLNDGHGGPAPDMAYPSALLRHDRLVDEELVRQDAKDLGLWASEGKDWCMSKRLWERTDRACNYGWINSVGVPVQPEQLGHSPHHVDYSQLGRWIRSDCLLPEGPAWAADIWAGTHGLELAKLLGGPLPDCRPPWAGPAPRIDAEPCPDTLRG